jgi:dihydrofolate reductase
MTDNGMKGEDRLTPWIAIAAMSLNRVIGDHGRIPWHLPEDFRFFKEMTTGNILVMGRRTFQSIGRALPKRHTLVLSREFQNGSEVLPQQELFPTGTFEIIHSPTAIPREGESRRVFICGGSAVYTELLPACDELYLTRVRREVSGDAFFPPFEHLFQLSEIIRDTPDFTIERWERRPDAPSRDVPVPETDP